MAVIDASVYVALVNAQEDSHINCWTWFQQAQDLGETVSAPVILLAEVAAALSRGLDKPALAYRIVQQLVKAKVIELVPISHTLAEMAAKIAIDHKIRGCDAIYVALAQQIDDYLVTLDEQQLNRSAHLITTRKPYP
jgi:predicted nucleic acid-binding protein